MDAGRREKGWMDGLLFPFPLSFSIQEIITDFASGRRQPPVRPQIKDQLSAHDKLIRLFESIERGGRRNRFVLPGFRFCPRGRETARNGKIHCRGPRGRWSVRVHVRGPGTRPGRLPLEQHVRVHRLLDKLLGQLPVEARVRLVNVGVGRTAFLLSPFHVGGGGTAAAGPPGRSWMSTRPRPPTPPSAVVVRIVVLGMGRAVHVVMVVGVELLVVVAVLVPAGGAVHPLRMMRPVNGNHWNAGRMRKVGTGRRIRRSRMGSGKIKVLGRGVYLEWRIVRSWGRTLVGSCDEVRRIAAHSTRRPRCVGSVRIWRL